MRRVDFIRLAILSLAIVVVGCGQSSGSVGTPSQVGSPTVDTSAEASASPTTATPAASGPTTPAADPSLVDLPTRIVVPDLGIDLPVVSGDLDVAGNPPDYPLCDVAQYLTTYRYPGRPGTTTWVYAHARDGMFVPLLEASETREGASLIGQSVQVYTDAGRRYTYRITTVSRHATDRSSASDVPADGGRLVLQTSEGPKGTVPKLQVVAELIEVQTATLEESVPPAKPRECFIP